MLAVYVTAKLSSIVCRQRAFIVIKLQPSSRTGNLQIYTVNIVCTAPKSTFRTRHYRQFPIEGRVGVRELLSTQIQRT
jgi:hypothetical protein